jgi:subtilisin family serine protease
MKRSLFVVSLVVVALAASVLPSGAVITGDGAAAGGAQTHALVRLAGEPVAVAAKTRPAPGKKINFNSTAVKSYRAKLAAQRNEFKQWLQSNARKAQVTGEFDTTVNALAVQLNGTSLEKLRSAPMAVQVVLQGTYRKAATDPDLALINAPQAWAAAGTQGGGIKIGIVDSGIAQYHPCFSDAGYAPQRQLGDTRYTNNKVIVARVFSNKARNRGYTPEAVDSHGTHVAGIAACNPDTPAAIDGVLIPHTRSGVAPKALLGNYNVFPGNEGSARDEDILQALEAAAQDGMDVVNMSLGGSFAGFKGLSTMAVDNMDRMGIVVAVASGNDGPGHYTVGAPGSAARALTAGSSQVGHGFVQKISVGQSDYTAVIGEFGEPTAGFSGPLDVVEGPVTTDSPLGLHLACTSISDSLTGKIALVSRGVCDFTVKVRNAQAAGAKGVIVANRIAGEPPFTMAHNGTTPKPTIPAYMVSREDGAVIKTQEGQTVVFYTDGVYETYPELTNRMATSSSQGPTDVDYRVKPDLVAPGDDVLSSFPGSCGALGCWAIIGGTSMASPHLAGAAAVVRAAEPGWTSENVRSAITNTANLTVLTTSKGQPLSDPQIEGAGLLDVERAVGAVAGLAPVSTSFGAVPSGAGMSLTRTVTITNLSDTAETFSVTAGAPFTVSGGPFTLAPGASAPVRVGYAPARKAPLGDVSEYLRVNTASDGEVAHAVLYAFLK